MKQRTFFIIGIVLLSGAVIAAVAVAKSTDTEKSGAPECTSEMMESMEGNMTEACTPEMMDGMKGNMTEGCTTEMMEHMGGKDHMSVHCDGGASMMGAGMMGDKGSMM